MSANTPHDHHGSYYVPDYSAWPILAAIGLFLLGLGSVQYFGADQSGGHILLAGIGILFLVGIGWFRAVIHESRAGLYDAQMHRTFLWGMLWFIFSDMMLFAAFVAVLWYYRIFNLPELSGNYSRVMTHFLLWPDFVQQWPVLINPDPSQFTGPKQGLVLTWQSLFTSVVMLASAVTVGMANRGLRSGKRRVVNVALFITFALALLFIVLNSESFYLATTRFGLTLGSGIYGSIVMAMLGIYLLHIVIATLLLMVVTIRSALGHFSAQDNFSVRALAWFWYFLTVVWIAIFLSVY